MKQIIGEGVCIAVMLFCACTDKQPAARDAKNPPRLSAAQAIESARKRVPGSDWQLAFLSNTGVPSSVTSQQMAGPEQGLMTRDGKAGQWVVEFFKDTPKAVSEGGRTGKSYPFKRVLVTATSAEELADSSLTVPQNLSSLKPEYVSALDTARNTAMSNAKDNIDILSVASDVKSDGTTTWVFRLYTLKNQDTFEKVTVSGDGKKVVQ